LGAAFIVSTSAASLRRVGILLAAQSSGIVAGGAVTALFFREPGEDYPLLGHAVEGTAIGDGTLRRTTVRIQLGCFVLAGEFHGESLSRVR
jgi:hypothetical protein